ncbi:MAG: single-stranded DNA-binding protein [Coriobacteriaceae bacterium]|nr:single-stranded DNA-binding protein [Coriobacteriaceae bacterium]
MSINKVMISGNLTRDPELRSTTSGMSVLGMSVAVNDRRKNQSTGEWEDYPNYIDCTLFGARAEGVAKFLTKGSKVAIEGKLRWSQWERDGQKRSKIEVIVDEIEFLTSRDTSSAPALPKTSIPDVPDMPIYDEDIPF